MRSRRRRCLQEVEIGASALLSSHPRRIVMRACLPAVSLFVLIPTLTISAQRSSDSQGSALTPLISANGIRVSGNALDANGSKLYAFGEDAGTTISLVIQAAEGVGII